MYLMTIEFHLILILFFCFFPNFFFSKIRFQLVSYFQKTNPPVLCLLSRTAGSLRPLRRRSGLKADYAFIRLPNRPTRVVSSSQSHGPEVDVSLLKLFSLVMAHLVLLPYTR